jgi:DNA-binding NarL/FixJ family response regulator
MAMAIVVLNTDPAIRAAANRMLDQARRHTPHLGQTGTNIAVLAAVGPTGPLSPLPVGSVLVVVTDHPSLAQAAAALLLSARAYLPLDLPPARTAHALRQVTQEHLHLEPETAAVLRALTSLGVGFQPHPHASNITTALSLHTRGWTWDDATQATDLDPADAEDWLTRLLAGLPRPPAA